MCKVNILPYLVVLIGYLFTVGTSGLIVRHFLGITPGKPAGSDPQSSVADNYSGRYNISTIIGKCENLLTITLILANAITGLALIFMAKEIVRQEDIRRDPMYYLGGTLVNFTYSVLMGFLIRSILKSIC